MYKGYYGIEPYLIYIKDPNYRIALSRLRMSSHNLTIETGRHSKPKVPVNERICTKCNMDQVQDEIHFVLKCPKFDTCRQALLDELNTYGTDFSTLSDADKFTYIMKSVNPVVLTKLGKFAYKGFLDINGTTRN